MLKQVCYSKLIKWIAGLLLVIGLVACAPEPPAIEVPPTQAETEAAVPSVTDTPEILPPTSEGASSVVLILGVEADPVLKSQTQELLTSLANAASLELVVLDTITPETITPEVQVVVGVGPNLDMNGLAASTPAVAFVAIGDPLAVVAGNLSVIGDPLVEAREQAFMAGYLSALIASDYKIVAILPAENEAVNLLADSYIVGARFYCGICQPIFPPFNPFPQWQSVPAAAGMDGLRPVLDAFANIGVEIVYVHGELLSTELVAYLDELGMKVVSDRTPEITRSNWVGTVITDPTPALADLWPALLMNTPGVQVPSTIVLTDTGSNLISEGRYRFFEIMVEELQSGMASFELAP